MRSVSYTHLDVYKRQPGNAGIAALAECVDIGVMDFDKRVAFAKDKAVDLVVVAPDDPLVAGAVDAFEAAGIRLSLIHI